ncbi:MAG: DUF1573 domain-containing protein [Bacteroidota bacterium]
MKRLLFILTTVVLTSCAQNTDNKSNKGLLSTSLVSNPRSIAGTDTAKLNQLASMDFTDTLHDFGTIHEGESVTHDFTFKNNGRSPLVISSAVGSCGCTVPDYPRDPIAPGKEAIVKVIFNSKGKSGHQEKSVTISTNSKRGIHMLYIKGEVTPEGK